MHYDDMIDPIWVSFCKYKDHFRGLSEDKAVCAAFYKAIKDHTSQLSSSVVIDTFMNTDEDFVKYSEEKRGMEIGKEINAVDELHNTRIIERPYGTDIIKEVFVIKLKASLQTVKPL